MDKRVVGHFVEENGNLCHRPPFKILSNIFMIKLQFWTRKPYVIASLIEGDGLSLSCVGYRVMRVQQLENLPLQVMPLSSGKNFLICFLPVLKGEL